MMPALWGAAGFGAEATDEGVYLHACGACEFGVTDLTMNKAPCQSRRALDCQRMFVR